MSDLHLHLHTLSEIGSSHSEYLDWRRSAVTSADFVVWLKQTSSPNYDINMLFVTALLTVSVF